MSTAYYQVNREVLREKQRLYRLANRDAINARQAAWRAKNRGRATELTRAWRASNPERARALSRLDNHRRRGARIDAEYDAILRSDPCSYCDAAADTVDHITAVTRGGMGGLDGTAACLGCNASKSDDDLLAFLLRRAP